MTDDSNPFASDARAWTPATAPQESSPLDLEAATFLELASRLGAADAAALAGIVRRAAEISEHEGEAMALAVLDQIDAILQGRRPDA
jgi:hypothetical protein